MLPFDPGNLQQTVFFLFTNAFVVLVSAFCALLFWVVHRRERKLRTAWRAAGFFALAFAGSVNILSPLLPTLVIVGAFLETLGFFLIYRGVKKELTLSHLRTISPYAGMTNDQIPNPNQTPNPNSQLRLRAWGFIGPWTLGLGIFFHLLSAGFIAATLRLQLNRFFTERDGRITFVQNLYPLAGYVCLFVAYLLLATSPLLPGFAWVPYAILVLTTTGFFLLSLWAWIFIRVRPTLRLSWLLIANGTLAVSFVAVALTSLVVWGLQTLLAEV